MHALVTETGLIPHHHLSVMTIFAISAIPGVKLHLQLILPILYGMERDAPPATTAANSTILPGSVRSWKDLQVKILKSGYVVAVI